MSPQDTIIMAVNAGSSSIKLATFTDKLEPLLDMSVTGIGQQHAAFTLAQGHHPTQSRAVQAKDHEAALDLIVMAAADQFVPRRIRAIGHRVVHGGPLYDAPVRVSGTVIGQLKSLTDFDPEHMPATIKLLEIFGRRFPGVPQVACFDTAFYRDLPKVARLLPLPRRFETLGLRRYGFHGLSYEYLLQRFAETAGETAAQGRIIFAHMGSGVSLTAVKDGKPLDTTMSFTPASGVPMSTRAGDLDPGIAMFLHRRAGVTFAQYNRMVHFESGLLGVSGSSADMEQLIRDSGQDEHAADAVELFCYEVRKTIGGFAAVLGGVDSLIFAGGMGENAPLIRQKVCEELAYLGVALDADRNQRQEFLISRGGSTVGVHVMHTDEAAVIAAHARRILQNQQKED